MVELESFRTGLHLLRFKVSGFRVLEQGLWAFEF